MTVRLTRLVGGERLRTDSFDGWTDSLPVVGRSFEIHGKSLTSNDGVRIVTTSKVVEVHEHGEFTTKSGSRYRVEVLALAA